MDLRERPYRWSIVRRPLSWRAVGIREARFLRSAQHAELTGDRQRDIQAELDLIQRKVRK